MNGVLRDLDDAQKIVMKVLKDKPETRSNDRLLILEVWEMQGLRLTEDQRKTYMHTMKPETITRGRRLVQEKGFYRGENYDQRQMFSEEVRKNI